MRAIVSNRRGECEVCTGLIDIGEPIIIDGVAMYHVQCASEAFSEADVERVLSDNDSDEYSDRGDVDPDDEE